jgi:hypothetical protein
MPKQANARKLFGSKISHESKTYINTTNKFNSNQPYQSFLSLDFRSPESSKILRNTRRRAGESLKAGCSNSEIKVKHGTCAETVRGVRQVMTNGGWIAPKCVPVKKARPAAEPRPPRVGMTTEERLQKHSGIAFWLRAGKTMAQAASIKFSRRCGAFLPPRGRAPQDSVFLGGRFRLRRSIDYLLVR